jgi:hypothetical protein
MKIRSLVIAAVLCGFVAPQTAIASTASDALGACMIDSLTGKERKELAQWIFFGMAAHPDIKKYSKVGEEDQINIDKFVGGLVTRLLTNDCLQQTKNAVNTDGPNALKDAFGLVGKVAMQELMSNKEVSTSLYGYAKYLDKKELLNIMSPK